MSTQYDSSKPELEGLTHAVSRAVLAHSCPEVLRHKTAEDMFGKLDRIITEYLEAFARVVKNAEDFNYLTVPAYLEALDRMTDHFSAIGIDDLYAQVFQEEGTDYSIDRSSRMEDALASMVYAMAPVVWPHASYSVLSTALYSPQHGLHLRGAILTVLHDSFSTKSGLSSATKQNSTPWPWQKPSCCQGQPIPARLNKPHVPPVCLAMTYSAPSVTSVPQPPAPAVLTCAPGCWMS
jgi:hypothetical protein